MTRLTAKNLEQAGWLFSPSLKVMVAEHELGRGKWDVEVQEYKLVNTTQWTSNDDSFWGAYNTIEEAIAVDPALGRVTDWINGNKVEMW